MAGIRVGQVRVVNASATIRHVYVVNFSSPSGLPFTLLETIRWGSPTTGLGVFTSLDNIGGQIRFTKTSGADPAPGDTISGDTSSASVDVDSLGPNSPPGFDSLITAGDRFHVDGEGAIYTIASSPLTPDRFTLAAVYDEDTQNEADYQITRDFTSLLSLPKTQVGDLDAPVIVAEMADQIDLAVQRVAYAQQVITPAGGAATVDWSKGLAADVTLSAATTFTFVPPIAPAWLTLVIRYSGNFSPTFPGTMRWPDSVEPTWSAAASEVDIVRAYYDGSVYHGAAFSLNSS